MTTTVPYPFSALVAAGDLELALALNAVHPAIGGVLVRGEKGTAKSTAVRGLAALLPEVEVVPGCRFACDPAAPAPGCPDGPHEDPSRDGRAERRPARLVELPVGASEDRVAGSLDLERALGEGRRAFEPGLLAAAHRGLLYVDEVNLLGDHLVDLLLDAAAMGVNHVEREGVSVSHPARFQLVGTMNPEEGELRPQLLDRFGLTVEVRAPREPAARAEVVRRRLAYEADPAAFATAWADASAAVAARIRAARKLLGQVRLGEGALRAVVAACTAFEVDGLRADLVTAKAACALAAWDGRVDVTVADVRAAALLALPHRRRRGPFEQPGLDTDRLDDALAEAEGDQPEPPGGDGGGGAPPPGGREAPAPPSGAGDARDDGGQGPGRDPGGPAVLPAGATFDPLRLELGRGRGRVGEQWHVPGRRSPVRELGGGQGAHVGDQPPPGRVARARDVALSGTLRAAAPSQLARGRRPGGPVLVRPVDLRTKVREGREGNLVLFVVDASGSMAARRRMSAVKGALLSLLLDAYQRRDRVGLVTFAGEGAELAVPPTASVELAARLLAELPTGGRTPLAAGLRRAAEVLAAERVRDPLRRPLLVLVTDGRATGPRGAGTAPVDAAVAAGAALAARRVPAVLVDTEDGPVRLGLGGPVAAAMGAPWLRLEELAASSLAGLVRRLVAPGGRAA